MPLFGKRNLVMLLVIKIFVIGLFLSGCQEGTNKSPVSSFLGIDANQATVDLTSLGDDVAKHTITGTVVSQNTGEKLANITVSLKYENQLAATTKTTSDGQFYFTKVPAGLFDLEFASPDVTYASTTYVLRVLEDGTTSPAAPEIRMALVNPAQLKVVAKIEGSVMLSGTDTKLANINVELRSAADVLITTALTGANGQFSFTNLGVGTYKIKAGGASNYQQMLALPDITIRDDGVVTHPFVIVWLDRIVQNFSITGLIRSSSNDSLSNLEVKCANDEGTTVSTRTTAEGKFYFENLPQAGMYYITVINGDKESDVYPVIVRPDGKTSPESVEILLPRTPTVDNKPIKGLVIDAFTGSSLEYATIKLGEGSNSLSTVTDVYGRFNISDLEPANYKITITKFGYDTLNTGFQINEDRSTIPATLTFQLLHSMRSDYGSIAGRYINDSGTGEAGIYVHLYRWAQVTKQFFIKYEDSLIASFTFLRPYVYDITDWEVVSECIITTITSKSVGDNNTPEVVGSFKMTHLEPGYYLMYISDSRTAPSIASEARTAYIDPYSNKEYEVNWQIPQGEAIIEIRGLKVESGKTTFWTNYEQSDRPDGW